MIFEMILIVIQVVVSALLALFLKTCTVIDEKRKVPNIVPIAILILGWIPVFGLIILISSIALVGCFLCNYNLKLKDNKFTRFLFGTK
jgi:ABC-type dipeptide/oligopeptide/nickel transport system permease component